MNILVLNSFTPVKMNGSPLERLKEQREQLWQKRLRAEAAFRKADNHSTCDPSDWARARDALEQVKKTSPGTISETVSGDEA